MTAVLMPLMAGLTPDMPVPILNNRRMRGLFRMMRKIVCLIMLVAMIILLTACAKDFTIHNGTKFGMTAEEVIATEQKKGFFADVADFEGKRLGASGTFAGRENGHMYYAFDSEGKLVNFHYKFKNSSLDDFDALNNSLISKYGKPNYSTETKDSFPIEVKWYPVQTDEVPGIVTNYAPVTGQSLHNTRTKEFFVNLFGTILYNYHDYSCEKYAQWIVRQKDGSAILIDHCYMSVDTFQSTSPVTEYTNLSTTTYELVIYTYLTPEEMAEKDAGAGQAMDDL